jgi:hypothetical protein
MSSYAYNEAAELVRHGGWYGRALRTDRQQVDLSLSGKPPDKTGPSLLLLVQMYKEAMTAVRDQPEGVWIGPGRMLEVVLPMVDGGHVIDGIVKMATSSETQLLP